MYVLPKALQHALKQPIGRLVQEPELVSLLKGHPYLVSVGDRVTFTLLSHGFHPSLCIVDFLLERKPCPQEMKAAIAGYGRTVIAVRNPPGTISDDLWELLTKVFQHPELFPVRLEVDGEEDLASLAAIALAPGDATIIYGLPNRGVVVVTATPEHKKKVDAVLRRM